MRCVDLFEAPISDLTHVGDWTKSSSFRHEQDRKLLTNPKAVQKIMAQWQKTPVKINMYLVNNADGTKHGEVGFVKYDWVQKNLPKTAPYINIDPSAINILYMNNTGSERVPMTGWVLAHRFGHAAKADRNFKDAENEIIRTIDTILEDGYGIKLKGDYIDPKLLVAFYEAIGTMRSARTNNLRNKYEFTYELLAQYMLTGRIKFNPIPKEIVRGRSILARFQGPDTDLPYYNNMLEDLADENLKHMFLNLLESCVGKILVM